MSSLRLGGRSRRSWKPIPVYATAKAWESIEVRFGYLVGSLIERHDAVVGEPLPNLKMKVVPFKTPWDLGTRIGRGGCQRHRRFRDCIGALHIRLLSCGGAAAAC